MTTRAKIAIVGLDGGTFSVLEPLIRAGAMPTLRRLSETGTQAVLRSTIPAYTPPAWVSIATGVNPGRHGVFGFLENTPQEPPRIAHSGSIRAAALWEHVAAQDATIGVFNVPMTYPPLDVQGFMVAGGLAAGWTDPGMEKTSTDPRIREIVHRAAGGPYPLDTVVSYENDWGDAAIASQIEAVQRVRRRALASVLEEVSVDVLFAVFEGPDRLQHVHYQYLVESSDWYGRPEATEARARAMDYFNELDRAIADIVEWTGTDGSVVLVSDHGAGPWEKTLNVNLLLDRWGYLALPAASRVTTTGMLAGAGQRLARRLLPRRMLLAAKARLNRGISWAQTRAYASQVAEQGIHINERGSSPLGVVEPADVPVVEAEIIDRLLDLRDPSDGGRIVDRVLRREEVISGPFAPRAPQLFPLCRDQRFELSDTIAATSFLTDHRDRPWGYHHLDGIFFAAGPAFAAARRVGPINVVDVLPTVLHGAGFAVPVGLDGDVVNAVLARPRASRAVVPGGAEETKSSDEYPFSPEDEREIEASLRGLGYLE